jgi:hypothetical protein
MSWGAQNRSKDAKTPNIGPAMSEKPIFYQLFNKLTPPPARPSDLKLAHWKLGINLLSDVCIVAEISQSRDLRD